MPQERYYIRKKRHQKDQTELKATEKKIMNIELDELQDTDFKTLFLNFITAGDAFKSALKKLKIRSGDHECNKLQKQEIIKQLADIQNIIHLKILSLRNTQINDTELGSSKTSNTQSSTQSLFSFQSELTSKNSSSPKCTGNNPTDSKPEPFSTSKLKSLSKQSLCSTKSSQYDSLDVDFNNGDDVDDDFDNVKVEKFKEFIVNVHCPFCLKLEDSTDSLAKHLDRTCVSFMTKIFVQNLHCPYSVFQLLPNNTFKCNICPDSVQSNLKKYFMHSQSAIHISGYIKATSHKNFTEFIFCAACKIQIPNNASQILFHMEHKAHRRNAKDVHSSHFFRQRGIQCVYSKARKFKCLKCPSAKSIHKSSKEILQHAESEAHVRVASSQKSEPLSTYTVYCMFCLVEVNIFNVLAHFYSSEHTRKEEEENNNEFQMCFYCDFKCSKLLKLAQHIDGCLDKIRQKDNHPESEEFDKVLGQIEKEQERPTKENTSEKGKERPTKENTSEKGKERPTKENNSEKGKERPTKENNSEKEQERPTKENISEKGKERPTKENTSEKRRCIIVKGYPKMLELYHYFKQFGEILEIEASGENTVMIKFQEEDTVDQILETGKLFEIKGLKITRKEDVDSSDVTEESSKTAESTKSFPGANNDGSDPSSTSRDVLDISNPTVDKDFSKVIGGDDTLESLFNRVSSHLSYTALKPSCEDFLIIAADCERILKLGKCHPVGFLKCGLTFPVEKITLYCDLSSSFIKETCSDEKSTSLTESILFNENLCKKCVSLLNNNDEIGRVSLREKSLPLIEFYHNKTKKLCTITFRQSDNILADELRYCLDVNEKLRSFFLIIRFWLSVHKLEIREFESVIISLLLFFLLSSGVVDTLSQNFSKKLKTGLPANRARSRDSRDVQSLQKKNYIVELFQNFLLFLNEFDFENMAICLPSSYPVPKTKLLQEPLKKYLCKCFNPDAPVWILDPFLFNNMAVDVKKVDWDSLLKTVRETIEHYHIYAKT